MESFGSKIHACLTSASFDDNTRMAALTAGIFSKEESYEESLDAFRYVLYNWDALPLQEDSLRVDMNIPDNEYAALAPFAADFSDVIEDVPAMYSFEEGTQVIFDLIWEEVDFLRQLACMEIILLSGFLPYAVCPTYRSLTHEESGQLNRFTHQVSNAYRRFVVEPLNRGIFDEDEMIGSHHLFSQTVMRALGSMKDNPFLLTLAIESLSHVVEELYLQGVEHDDDEELPVVTQHELDRYCVTTPTLFRWGVTEDKDPPN